MDFDPRDHGSRHRDSRDIPDLRDAFMCDLDLPRGTERESVRNRDHEYTLKGSETQARERLPFVRLSTMASSAHRRQRQGFVRFHYPTSRSASSVNGSDRLVARTLERWCLQRKPGTRSRRTTS